MTQFKKAGKLERAHSALRIVLDNQAGELCSTTRRARAATW